MRNATPFLAFVLAGLFMAGPAVAEKQKKAPSRFRTLNTGMRERTTPTAKASVSAARR